MQILHPSDIQFTPDDVVFRESAVNKVLVILLFLAAAAAVVVAWYLGKLPLIAPLFSVPFLLLFVLLSALTLRKVFRPENWLLACNTRRLLIKFRSYLNNQFPATDPQMLMIELSEVSAIREALLDVSVAQRGRARSSSRARFLDIMVRGPDLTSLRERLKYERELRPGGQAWLHYPVTVLDDTTIRVEWSSPASRVTPGLADALRLLGALTDRREARREEVDFTDYRKMPPVELERQIRALAERGEIIRASQVVQYVYGVTTGEARAYVEKVSTGT